MADFDVKYENQNGRKGRNGERKWDIDVRLDGKVIGEIIRLADGYAYKPAGRKHGEVFPSLDACKASVEGSGADDEA